MNETKKECKSWDTKILADSKRTFEPRCNRLDASFQSCVTPSPSRQHVEGNWCYAHWNEASSLLHRGSKVFFEPARFSVSYNNNFFFFLKKKKTALCEYPITSQSEERVTTDKGDRLRRGMFVSTNTSITVSCPEGFVAYPASSVRQTCVNGEWKTPHGHTARRVLCHRSFLYRGKSSNWRFFIGISCKTCSSLLADQGAQRQPEALCTGYRAKLTGEKWASRSWPPTTEVGLGLMGRRQLNFSWCRTIVDKIADFNTSGVTNIDSAGAETTPKGPICFLFDRMVSLLLTPWSGALSFYLCVAWYDFVGCVHWKILSVQVYAQTSQFTYSVRSFYVVPLQEPKLARAL